jgi:exopolyphosphatase/guanosine-5'-triphosphate,3'-diphosphate pyrophosphatase
MIGVIDIGSNSTNLLISHNGNTLVREQKMTRLGTGVLRTKMLSAESMEDTLQQLRYYSSVLTEHNVKNIHVVATAAVRHAGNGTEFLANVESIVGVAPRLISGEEEGRLSFIGAQQQLPLTNNPQLIAVIDIGGGSTEIAVGNPNSAPRVVSIPYGARSLTEKEIHSDPPRPEELTNAIGVIIDEVDDVLREIPELADCDEIIGVAGTIVTIAMVELGLTQFDVLKLHGFALTRDAAEDVFRTLATEALRDRLFNPGLNADRADVIVGGCCALVAIMRKLQRSHIIISTASLLDGVVATETS